MLGVAITLLLQLFDMKTCGSCQVEKPPTDFARKGKGYCSKCRSCQKQYWSEWYANPENKAQHIATSRRHSKRDKREFAAVIAGMKAKPCADCGREYPPYIMDFDHLPGMQKVSNVCKMLSEGRAKKAVLDEISKCEVVCANCHRERTHKRRQVLGK